MYTVVFSVFICCVGGLIHLQDGFKQRFAINEAASEQRPVFRAFSVRCFLSTDESYEKWSGDNCFIGPKLGSNHNTLLWGDSHANHLVSGIHSQKLNIKNNILLYASAGCPPIFDAQPNNRPNCAYNNSNVIQVIKSHNISHVVLASNWQYAATQGVELNKLGHTINKLKALDVKVSLINQLPIYPINNPEYLILRLSNGKPFNEDWHLKPSKGQKESKQVKHIANTSNIPVVDSMSSFCNHGECMIIRKGNLMVKDAGHLSELGSSYFITSMLNQNIDFWD